VLKVERVNTIVIIDNPVRLVDVANAEGQSGSNLIAKIDTLSEPAVLEDLS
jgi:hypothetical protein